MTSPRFPPRRPLPLAVAAVAAALTALVAGALPASAHGQEVLISLEATAGGDGTAEVTAVVRFEGDGHPADGVVLRTTAVSGSEQVDVELAAAGEPGTYTGTAELTPGTWEITTEATGDHAGTAVTELAVPEPAPTTTEPPATTTPPPDTTEAPPATDPAEPAAAESSTSPLLVAVPVALVAVGAAVLAWRRFRRA